MTRKFVFSHSLSCLGVFIRPNSFQVKRVTGADSHEGEVFGYIDQLSRKIDKRDEEKTPVLQHKQEPPDCMRKGALLLSARGNL